MSVPHPIPYQGSKRHLAKEIMQYFPDDVDCLIEPFAGSAALSLAAAYHRKVARFALNDINDALMSLWQSIIDRPEFLGRYYERLWRAQSGCEREFYDQVRDRFNQTQKPYYLLYLLARCVKAAVRYNANGEFNQSPDNRRKGRNPATMKQDILAASQLLRSKTTITSLSYTQIIHQASPQDLVYMDPPYQGVYANRDPRYIQVVGFDDFVDQLSELNARDTSYIVSYDGRTGTKSFGSALPNSLKLRRIEIMAGRSSQATLLGQDAVTYESLYLSAPLIERLASQSSEDNHPEQLRLFGELS